MSSEAGDPTLAAVAKYVGRLDSVGVDPGALTAYLVYASHPTSDPSGEGTRGSSGGKADLEASGIGRYSQPITAGKVATELSIHREAVGHLFDTLAGFGVIAHVGSSGRDVSVNREAANGFMNFIERFCAASSPRTRELLAEDDLHDIDFYYAVPPDFNGLSSNLMARLTRMIDDADRSVLLVTPFFNRFGVEAFIDRLASATGRGVAVRLLTRDVYEEDGNAGPINDIVTAVARAGDPESLSIYDYGTAGGRLHAKALVADRELAYVGSANLTGYSLQKAIEVGIVTTGPVVDDLLEFFGAVINSNGADRINDEDY